MTVSLDDLGNTSTEWVSWSGAEFLVKRGTPALLYEVHARCMEEEIMRFSDGVAVGFACGKFESYCRVIAEELVIDWRGNIKPPGTKYSSELMVRLLLNLNGLLEKIQEVALQKREDFHCDESGGYRVQ